MVIKKMYKKKGFTLVEVMVAIVIFTIVVLGGFVFFFYGRSHISLSNHQRMALELTKEKIEICKASGCSDLLDEGISLGGIQFARDTVNNAYVGYNELTVIVRWQEGANPYSVQLITIIAED